MELGLRGKVAAVTGASKGMGKAIALGLSREGARVCIVARTRGVLESTANEIRNQTGEDVLAIQGDVAHPSLPKRLTMHIKRTWEPIDILVNNAGGPPPGSLFEHNEIMWHLALQQNFLSVVRMTQAVAPDMKKRGWGRILTLTSTLAKEPSPQMILSASVRAAVTAFSKAAATELAPFNVTVNTVSPGSVLTDRAVSLLENAALRQKRPYEEALKESQSSIPMQRFASPEEIANVVVFLASERSGYLTGSNIVVDGGLIKSVF